MVDIKPVGRDEFAASFDQDRNGTVDDAERSRGLAHFDALNLVREPAGVEQVLDARDLEAAKELLRSTDAAGRRALLDGIAPHAAAGVRSGGHAIQRYEAQGDGRARPQERPADYELADRVLEFVHGLAEAVEAPTEQWAGDALNNLGVLASLEGRWGDVVQRYGELARTGPEHDRREARCLEHHARSQGLTLQLKDKLEFTVNVGGDGTTTVEVPQLDLLRRIAAEEDAVLTELREAGTPLGSVTVEQVRAALTAQRAAYLGTIDAVLEEVNTPNDGILTWAAAERARAETVYRELLQP